jgi:hypothetical protein
MRARLFASKLPDEEHMTRPVGAWRHLLCAYLVFHLGAVTVVNLPRTTALGDVAHRPFDLYVATAGLWQGWDMFTTIPHFLDLDGTLIVVDAQGAEHRLGPLLPGLAPYEKLQRVNGTFIRLAFSSNEYPGYSNRYLAAVCRAVTAQTGAVPASVGFELHVMELRSLASVRADGRIAEPKTLHFGPTPCAR